MPETRKTIDFMKTKSHTGRIFRLVHAEFQKELEKNPENPVLHIKPSTIGYQLKLPTQTVSHNMRFLDECSDMVATPIKIRSAIHEFEIKLKCNA